MNVLRRAFARQRTGSTTPADGGFMMVAILIGMGVAAIMMTAMLPKWRQQVQRQREEELIFRGEQYARAIVLYYVKNRGAYPPSIDVLVSDHYLRKKWKDPVTNDDFALVGSGIINLPGAGQSTPVGGQTPTPAGSSTGRGGASALGGGNSQQPGITGVRSKSTETSIKIYQQQQEYDLWQFDARLIAPKMGINMNAAQQGQGQGGRQGGQGQGGRHGGVGGGGRGGRGGQPGGGRGGATGPGGGRGGGAPPIGGTGGRGRGGL
jgi:type II secretory pathway pseudopilin PulG